MGHDDISRTDAPRATSVAFPEPALVIAEPAWRLERSCCCPSRPAVRIVMPPTDTRSHPVDLLLCMHHYRATRDSLAAAGGVVFDRADRAARHLPSMPVDGGPLPKRTTATDRRALRFLHRSPAD